MRIAKAYNCKSNEALRTAYIKQAAQLRICANDIEAAVAEAARQPREAKGPQSSGEGASDQDSRSMDMPAMRNDYDLT